MAFMDSLCRFTLLLFPQEFRAEFADEALATFQKHYRRSAGKRSSNTGLTQVWHQLVDVAGLAAVGAGTRLAAFLGKPDGPALSGHGYTKEAADMSIHRVIWRVYFAWQAEEEAGWLTDMSREGWHFLDYKPFWYWFRRLEVPVPLEFYFERRYFWWWQAHEEEAFLDHKALEGWEFFKFFAGWYYFRRPIDR